MAVDFVAYRGVGSSGEFDDAEDDAPLLGGCVSWNGVKGVTRIGRFRCKVMKRLTVCDKGMEAYGDESHGGVEQVHKAFGLLNVFFGWDVFETAEEEDGKA